MHGVVVRRNERENSGKRQSRVGVWIAAAAVYVTAASADNRDNPKAILVKICFVSCAKGLHYTLTCFNCV